jgi:hypothetical protein
VFFLEQFFDPLVKVFINLPDAFLINGRALTDWIRNVTSGSAEKPKLCGQVRPEVS